MPSRIQNIRTTRANLESRKTANGLLIGEVYLVTDETPNVFCMGTSINTYNEYLTKEQINATLGDIETLLDAI